MIACVLVTSTTVSAEEAEDPKQALRDRGIVRKVGKKFYVFIVPPQPGTTTAPKDATLNSSTIYFGELGKMRVTPGESWTHKPIERRILSDERSLYFSEIERNADFYTITCTATYEKKQTQRRFELTSLDADAAADAIAAAKLFPAEDRYQSFLLGRVAGTTYLYVDRRGREGTDYRVYLGKRGAMKKLAIKEVASDSEELLLVTAKGTLTMKWDGSGPGNLPTATWGSAKKPAPLTTLRTFDNRGLIYRELGVYTKEPSGHPCHEL